MKLTKFAQSTVLIENTGKKLLIDPGNYNFEPGRLNRDSFSGIDVMIITHKHADHFDADAVKSISTRSSPLILTVEELVRQLSSDGIKAQVLGVGGVVESSGFRIQGVRAKHIVKDEVVDAIGVVVEANGKRVYHTSDTLYVAEQPSNIDVIFVPINNRGVAMDFDDAARFVREIAPHIAVPVHYDSPKDAHIKPHDWAKLFNDSKIQIKIMSFGNEIEI